MQRRRTPLVVLATAAVALVALADATRAARSSKPKEIVVVGSKVKEVIRESGLETGPAVIQTLSRKVLQDLREAIGRALANHRFALAPHDLSCFGEPLRDDLLVKGARITQLLKRRGFEADASFIAALSGHVEILVEQAIERARSNGRSTVRPYDL